MSAPPRTLTELFFDAVHTYGAHPAAFRHKVDGAWRDVSHQEAATRVQALSLGVRELGLPWPSVFPSFEYCVNVRPMGFTGFEPANSVSLVESPTRPSVRP